MGFLKYLLLESYLTILSLVSCFSISLPREMLAYCNAEISWLAVIFKPFRLAAISTRQHGMPELMPNMHGTTTQMRGLSKTQALQ